MAKNVVATLYCIAVYIATICTAQQPIVPGCCTKWSETEVKFDKLKSYVKLSTPCRINAIKFLTMKGKAICSDPNSSWAKRAMIAIDERGRTTITTTTTPITTHSTTTPSTTTPSTTTPGTTTPSTTTPSTTTPGTTTPSTTTPGTTTSSTMTPGTTTPGTTTPSTTTPGTPTPSTTTPSTMTPSTTTPGTMTPSTTTPGTTSTTRTTAIMTWTTRKIRWIKNRRNRWKKPGLRSKMKGDKNSKTTKTY